MKTCSRCETEQDVEEFRWRNANGKRARKAHCRNCENAQRRNRYQTDPGYRQTKLAYSAASYRRHHDEALDRQCKYSKTDAGRTANRTHNLKSRYGIDIGHTEAEWRRLLARFDFKCFYCVMPATERDHILPLSRGGSDAIGNILPSCRDCNNRKDKKLLIEFRRK